MSKVADIHLIGLDSAKPAASSANTGYYYTSTDVAGGTTYRSNGSTWDQIASGASGSHAAVTLGTDADTILGLSTQQITLDTQAANKVLAGPTTGADADPTFRSLVVADLGTGSPDSTKFLRGDGSWAVPTASDVGGIPLATVDAAGDLLVGTADNVVSRLGVGADGTVLGISPTTHVPVWAALTDAQLVGLRHDVKIFTVENAATAAAGKLRIYNKSGLARTINKVWVCANTAPTGADLIVDIHLDGTTIHTTQSNRAKIAASANYGDTSTIEVATWSDGHYLTMDVDQVGSTVAGSDVTVGVEYTY